MRFWKSYICSNKLDVEETNLCFKQFNRIRNHLFGHWIEIGWVACSGIMGSNCFCLCKRVSDFHIEQGDLLMLMLKEIKNLEGRSV